MSKLKLSSQRMHLWIVKFSNPQEMMRHLRNSNNPPSPPLQLFLHLPERCLPREYLPTVHNHFNNNINHNHNTLNNPNNMFNRCLQHPMCSHGYLVNWVNLSLQHRTPVPPHPRPLQTLVISVET
eukprot:PhF_6_TR20823/c0_g1_i2/m.29968